MAPENRRWLPVALAVFVVTAGTVVGGFFGRPASFLYGPMFHNTPQESTENNLLLLGMILGGVGGAGAGILWSWLMGRLSPQAGGWRILLAGTGWGIVVGTLDTFFLHVGLMAASGFWVWGFFGAILFFGIPAGLATGFVCGLLRWGVVARMRRISPPAGL